MALEEFTGMDCLALISSELGYRRRPTRFLSYIFPGPVDLPFHAELAPFIFSFTSTEDII